MHTGWVRDGLAACHHRWKQPVWLAQVKLFGWDLVDAPGKEKPLAQLISARQDTVGLPSLSLCWPLLLNCAVTCGCSVFWYCRKCRCFRIWFLPPPLQHGHYHCWNTFGPGRRMVVCTLQPAQAEVRKWASWQPQLVHVNLKRFTFRGSTHETANVACIGQARDFFGIVVDVPRHFFT